LPRIEEDIIAIKKNHEKEENVLFHDWLIGYSFDIEQTD